MNSIDSPILTIPSISHRMGAVIVTKIGGFSKSKSPDKILANVAISHAAKKLVRVIFHLVKSKKTYKI